ncbi:E7 [Leptonychotes weddellii papillomavirus 3]|uniref:Protein E7 n=1 Tax=Leptonychotes weddellii papillomavirus 3 TaxID=2077304 RepID=A0A2I8B2P5_9PAPI|nr:E7 [Leptonychotes weddellii papillomavirus 3]AUT11912.1 E7 [Leptonychotes weddellii papillomavirus 3]
MIGTEPTLKDIVLGEQPVPADDLWCYEELPPEEAERSDQAPYRVHASCGFCGRGIELVVLSSRVAIRTLQHLLLENLDIVCPDCARTRALHHGG